MEWEAAKPLWTVFLSCLWLTLIYVLIRWAEFPRNSPGPYILAIIGLTCSPSVFAIGIGQPSLFACTMLILGLFATTARRHLLGGALVGLALAMKPQLGGPVLLYFAITLDMRAMVTSIATASTLGLIGITPFILDGNYIGWLSDWLEEGASMPGLNVALDNPRREGRLNLGVLLHVLVHDPAAVRLIAIGIVGCALAYWCALVRRVPISTPRDCLLIVSPLLMLLLLPVYHRYYDGMLIMVPAAWACSELLTGRYKKTAIAVILLALQFCVIWSAVLVNLQLAGKIPSTVLEYRAWHLFVIAHPSWTIVATAGLTMWTLAREARTSSSHNDMVPASPL